MNDKGVGNNYEVLREKRWKSKWISCATLVNYVSVADPSSTHFINMYKLHINQTENQITN